MIEEWKLNILCCPNCKSDLCEKEDELICAICNVSYPIINYIPRFVELDNYADSFGFQWNLFKKTQHDKYSNYGHSNKRFETEMGWQDEEIKNNIILDAGCGNGRFTEVALSTGANVVALDLSGAVESCYLNMIEAGHEKSSFIVLQASFYNLPIKHSILDKAFSLGVLQHTPDPKKSLEKICDLVRKNGDIAFWVYEKNWKMWIGYLYYFRIITKHLSQKINWELSSILTNIFFPLAWILDKFFGKVGNKIMRICLPLAFRKVHENMNYDDSKQWSLLDTFDNISPRYDSSISEIKLWLKEAGFTNIKEIKFLD